MSDPERYHLDVSGLSGDHKRFRDRWSPVRSLESENQGLAYEAIDAAGIRAFVKEFRPNQGSERRARFCREVRILAGLAITGIPRLLESNGEHFADSSFELYLATEYIDGVRLSNLVNAGLEPLGAIDLVLQVCTVVSAAQHGRRSSS